jgi:hypothetical protein
VRKLGPRLSVISVIDGAVIEELEGKQDARVEAV